MMAGAAPRAITTCVRYDVAAEVGSTERRAIYAIGDVHGCYDLAYALLGMIVADIRGLGSEVRPVIVMCGDYVDRGPRSADIVAMLLWMERSSPCDVILLKGNHEAMLLDFIDRPIEARGWLELGGAQTLASYGIDPAPALDHEGDAIRLRDAFLDAIPSSHVDLLRRLTLHWQCGDYVFVHAGLRPGVALQRQSEADCLWIRDEFLFGPRAHSAVVVHGHSWSGETPEIADGRLGIDTGAYQTGVLTAVRLDGAKVSFLQACAVPDISEGDGDPAVVELNA